MTESSAPQPRTLTDYLTVLRRRKWIVIAMPIVAALAALQYSSSQPSVYRADAKILVNRSAGVVGAITEIQDPATYDPTRYLNTLAITARSSTVAERVAARDDVPRVTAGAVLGAVSISPDAEADLLNVSVSSRKPDDAVRLVNAYATEFIRYRTQSDKAFINENLRGLKKNAAQLRRRGQTESLAYQTLLQDQTKLEAAADVVDKSLILHESATGAAKVQPRPRRAVILGGLLGAVFALGLAFLAEALDKRVRTETEIEETLGLPLLGRIARPPSSLARKNRLVMVAEPMSVHAEGFRKLCGTIELVNLQRGAGYRTILFTSAAQQEGKSTTVANLAIALARSGERVALVDLDLRRPFLHTFFGVRSRPGFTDVVVGTETLDRALRHLSLPTAGGAESLRNQNGRRPGRATGSSDATAVLPLLPCGTIPPAAAEFLASEQISVVLEKLRGEYDFVLVDAPPITAVGDAMMLSAAVDAIVVVTALGIQRPLLNELARELQNCRAASLGLILTGVAPSDAYLYWYRSFDEPDARSTPTTRGDGDGSVEELRLREASSGDATSRSQGVDSEAADEDIEPRQRHLG